jgi:Bacterial regulatory proteins, tetR family
MPMPSAGCAPATSQRRSWVPVAACPSGLGDDLQNHRGDQVRPIVVDGVAGVRDDDVSAPAGAGRSSHAGLQQGPALPQPGRNAPGGLELFARHGYAGTSVRAIARAVGASQSVLYKHFANKQALFDQVLYQAGAGLLVDQLAEVDPRLAATDPPAFLRAVTERLLRTWDQPRARRLTSVLGRSMATPTPR